MELSGAILIIDDGQAQESLLPLLADQGYDLSFVGSGPDVVSQAVALQPDLILLNASESGLKICRRLRAMPILAETPILAAVADTWQGSRRQAIEAGADDFVTKPFEGVELLTRIRAFIRFNRAAHRHVDEVTTLNKISQSITASLDLSDTLSIIAENAHWLLDVEAVSVILYERESGDLWFGASSGAGASFIRDKRLPKGPGIVNWVIEHGKPLTVLDTSRDPRFFDEWDKASGFRTRSILCVPLEAKGQITGAIEAINKTRGQFNDDDLALLTSMATSASIAIENARLYEQAQAELSERRRVEAKLRKLNRALRTLSECHETLIHAEQEPEMLQVVCRNLVEIGGRCMAWVGLVEGETGAGLHVAARARMDDGYIDNTDIAGLDEARDGGPTDTAIRTRAPCVVQDLRLDPSFAPWRARALKRGCTSIIALPLLADDRVLGALTVYDQEPDAFDSEEADLLKQLANDLALGIMALRTRAERDRAEDEIRRLYQELQDHANNLERIVDRRTHELQAERDRTQAILEAVGEAVIVTDLQGRIQYLNPAAEELTGYTLEEAVGRSPLIWQHDQQATEPYASSAESPSAIQTQRAEVVSRHRDGALYDAAMTVAPLFHSQDPDRLVGHVCVQRDITPLKDAERLKDEFVSNVSHELRTPLSVIALVSGNLDRLYDQLPDEKRRKMVQDIREHAQVLNELIGDVLEISRIESGRISMERQRIDLAGLVREEAEKQRPLAHRQSQKLLVRGAESLFVQGNDEQLRQVVRNLLNNAIKYTPQRGEIVCECAELSNKLLDEASEAAWPGSADLLAAPWAALRVADTGFGIGPEDLPHVYERFYRVKNQGNIPGTGLGLSIVKELIESHGGRIAATSNPGKGSVFAIYLPLTGG